VISLLIGLGRWVRSNGSSVYVWYIVIDLFMVSFEYSVAWCLVWVNVQ
jgi:hypothetical protein